MTDVEFPVSRDYPLQAIADALALSDALCDADAPAGHGVTYEVAGKILDELLAGPLDDVRVLDKLLRDKMAREGIR